VVTTATLRDPTGWDALVTELGQQGLVRHGLRHTAMTWMAEHGGVPADMAHTRGVAWGEHHPDLFVGTERFFRTNYIAHLTDHWIRRWKGWKRSCALVPRSPMSAAGTARRR